MSCCASTIFPFTNQSTSTIGYAGGMAALYGPQPNVEVFYREGSEYVQSDLSQVIFDGSTIQIDHGGSQTGIVKVN